MSRSWVIAGAIVCFVAMVSGCVEETQPAGTPIERAWEPSDGHKSPAAVPAPAQNVQPVAAAKPAPTSQPVPKPATTGPADEVIASVNGSPIMRSTLTNLLLESHGLSMLENLVLLTAAKQKAAAMSLTVTPADIKAAHEDALRRLATPFTGMDRPPLDRAAAARLLREFLVAKNISQREWDLRMEQRAYIGKIAAAEVARSPVTDEMLRMQYAQDYGEKVQIRHIQLSSLAQVTQAKALLAEKPFELVAREMSQNDFTASQGGLMPPFTREDQSVPPLLRETAFTLKVGEVSTAIHEQNTYQLIKVEKKFPASSIGFENADKDKLRARVLDQLTRQRMDDLEGELFRNAAVDIHDARLGTQFRDRHRSQK